MAGGRSREWPRGDRILRGARLRHSIWSDKRLWFAVVLAFLFRTALNSALTAPVRDDLAIENPALAPTRPPEPATGPAADFERVLQEQQIRRINLNDGSSAEPPMSPGAAAAWFGGLVLFLGGFGTVWLWRRAEQAERDRQAQT